MNGNTATAKDGAEFGGGGAETPAGEPDGDGVVEPEGDVLGELEGGGVEELEGGVAPVDEGAGAPIDSENVSIPMSIPPYFCSSLRIPSILID